MMEIVIVIKSSDPLKPRNWRRRCHLFKDTFEKAMVKNPKYDVAISFLQRDVGTARALAARLQEHLQVFFYPNRQEDPAGTDGMDFANAHLLQA